MKHAETPAGEYKTNWVNWIILRGIQGTGHSRMNFKIFVLTSVFLICQGDRLYDRRLSPRLWLNGQGFGRPEWNYQLVNGRPVVSGFPTPNSYVAFELNPQTGQIEQSQIVAQTRPGGPIISMIQNMMHVAGQFMGQLTGAVGNAVGGALQTAGQLGQDIRDITNPVVGFVPRPSVEKEPLQQPTPRPPIAIPSVRPPSVLPVPSVRPPAVLSVTSIPPVDIIPVQAKSDVEAAARAIDLAIAAFQTLRTSVTTNFQTNFEDKKGQQALSKINENFDEAVSKLQGLVEVAASEPKAALQSGKSAANAALDNVEASLVGVAGNQGSEFIRPARNQVNVTFDAAIQVSNQSKPSENSAIKIPSLE